MKTDKKQLMQAIEAIKAKLAQMEEELNKQEGFKHFPVKNDDCWAKGFFEDTEIEAIIKSCEFILTKKESK